MEDYYIIGIDPGKSGGIAVLTGDGKKLVYATRFAKFMFISELMKYSPAYIYIEQVHAMPGQGVVSMFTFGKEYGWMLGCIEALSKTKNIELKDLTQINPIAWKNYILKHWGGNIDNYKLLDKRNKKKFIASIINKIFNLDDYKNKNGNIHDGITDAIGIALFGMQLDNSYKGK